MAILVPARAEPSPIDVGNITYYLRKYTTQTGLSSGGPNVLGS